MSICISHSQPDKAEGRPQHMPGPPCTVFARRLLLQSFQRRDQLQVERMTVVAAVKIGATAVDVREMATRCTWPWIQHFNAKRAREVSA
jgi:hypothetical protein